MRIALPIAAVGLIVVAAKARMHGWIVGLLPIVLLWNPLAPVYLNRSTWVLLDLAGFAYVAGFFYFVTLPIFRTGRAD